MKKGLVALLILASLIAVVAATWTDVFEWAWNRLRYTQLFIESRKNEFWFYYLQTIILYPILWSLVGIVALFAIVKSSRLAWYAITVFSVSFLVMSFAGPKATRYLSFAQPFLVIVWGAGLAYILPPLWRYAGVMRIRLAETFALPQRVTLIVGNTVVILVLSTVALSNPFWVRTATMIGNIALPIETPMTDWRAARAALGSWTAKADIMITTEELGAIYFFGRSDVRFSSSKLRELAPDQQKEFGIDYRTGRPIISKPESLEQLITCFERGIIVGPIEHWGNSILISEAVQNVITRYARPIEVPKESYLYAWGWEHEFQETRPSYCSDLSRFSGRQTH
jgi:hypothetical protein